MGGPILTPFQRSTYQIVWANSYELISNGVPVFRLRQQMQQSIEIHPIWDHNSRFCTRFGRNEYNLK
ncbi:unnamed protein product [Rhizophagus irregularis]|uniref:Uncharacterized protein n=1 Tax=Rhizophagus irregularis TaxID=588596 RepID=A0A915Z4K7_9GLOM|nr:unnamed protein product [Rhizophagus irregularis]CAB5362386.1 unnamed protein product [Rhizophagus irregularis]